MLAVSDDLTKVLLAIEKFVTFSRLLNRTRKFQPDGWITRKNRLATNLLRHLLSHFQLFILNQKIANMIRKPRLLILKNNHQSDVIL